MLTSCAVENTPACPATPPMRRVVGSNTTPRSRKSKSGFLPGSFLLSSSCVVGAMRDNRLVLHVPAGQTPAMPPIGAGAQAIADPRITCGPHALAGGRYGFLSCQVAQRHSAERKRLLTRR